MEVHQHTHTPRKKWTHYFFEFFMLFLAVTAGFLVENMRHHGLERKYEKQYMQSLVEDLQSDTSQINQLLALFGIILKKEDSLKNALMQPDVLSNAANAYRYVGYPLDGYAFHRSERTIQQLKNAGGLRLIHSIEVSNRINEYDETFRKSQEINGVQIETYFRYIEIFNRTVNANLVGYPYKENGIKTDTINYKWITNDRKDLDILLNTTINFQWVSRIYVSFLETLHKQAVELIAFLKKEYHLK